MTVNKKKRTHWIIDFAVPADHRVKLKESKKKDKYLDLAGELKKIRNMKMIVTPVVSGALDTIIKGMVQGLEFLEIRWREETIQTTAFLRSEYWEESWRVKETCCHSNYSKKPLANIGVKTFKGVK